MKASVYSCEGKVVRQVDLPAVFETPHRPDLVKRAVLSEESMLYQPKGSYRWAGLNTSARYRGRKDDFGTVKNRGIPHLPHEVLPGGQLGKVKRVPHAVRGRRAHPPKSAKKIIEFINPKERNLALASALAICADRKSVTGRSNSDIGVSLPIIMENDFENIGKAKDVMKVFESLNLVKLMEKAKRNGTKAPLIVVSSGKVLKAAANIAGVDVVKAADLKVMHLAPGTHAGRLTLFSENALPEIAKRFVI
jgi:large subunit ribosomal protein L4e